MIGKKKDRKPDLIKYHTKENVCDEGIKNIIECLSSNKESVLWEILEYIEVIAKNKDYPKSSIEKLKELEPYAGCDKYYYNKVEDCIECEWVEE